MPGAADPAPRWTYTWMRVDGQLAPQQIGARMADEQETILIAGDPEAPLIQLGVTDISTYIPLARPLGGRPLDVKRAIGPEAERRVLVDWGLLASPEPATAAEELLAMARDNPRWIALAPARPGYAAELRQLLEQGAGGAFIYPGLDRAFPWADSVRQLGQVLTQSKKPVLVHGGPGPAPLRFDGPALWDEFLMEFPHLPVIIHSMGQRSPYLEEALVLAERHAQVHLETSRAPIGAVKEAIRTVGPDRVLFGSGGLAQDFHQEWEKIERLEPEISPDAFQKIVNLNARRLFFQLDGQERRAREQIHPFRRPS
ncbi:MAG: amidohydrolase family protein [Firmicutes bacterium]|nr:amidohydrolase family protein [Bacillota bacterium]